jgi:hypothetical protein
MKFGRRSVTVTGSGNQTAGAGASNNIFTSGSGSVIQTNGVTVKTDGSVKAAILINDGQLLVNGRLIELDA